MAIMLTVAKVLAAKRHQLKGSVKFLFQPAEEGHGGAPEMIKDGCLENPKGKEHIYLHTGPNICTVVAPLVARLSLPAFYTLDNTYDQFYC